MQAHLERIEVEPRGGRDHDLTVDDRVRGQGVPEDFVQIREVAIERTQIAALDVHSGIRTAKDDGAKTVPLRFVKVLTRRRDFVNQPGEHRLDRRSGNGSGAAVRHECASQTGYGSTCVPSNISSKPIARGPNASAARTRRFS